MLSRLAFTGLIGAIAASGTTALAQPSFTIDGQFNDWNTVSVSATDQTGDNSGAFDLTQVKAFTRGTVVFIQWDTNAFVNLQAGNGGDGTIRIELGFASGSTLTVDTRSRIAYENGNTGSTVSWYSIDYTTLPTAALPLYETRIDVANYAAIGEAVSIDFSGSDTLDAGPISVTLNNSTQAPPNPQPGDLDPTSCTDFRVLSLNTLRSGMTSNNQAPQFGRIFDAMNPQIICLQEEYNNNAATIKGVIEGFDPTNNGQPWNVHMERDNAIASQFPLIPYNTGDSYAAAVVDMGNLGAVFVVSVHTKCCGFAGDSSDNKRIASMQNLAGIISNLRSGSLGGAMAPYANAPVVVVGDWNHVGSDTPLQIMIDPAIPAMQQWVVSGAATDDAATWRDVDGFGFMPGMLDLLVYDTAGLSKRAGFLLDTRNLNGTTLASYALQSADSGASDHRAIIADFEFGTGSPTGCLAPCPADLNGDGFVDNGDIAAFVTLFLAGDLVVDFTGDGVLDNGDIGAFVAAFLTGC